MMDIRGVKGDLYQTGVVMRYEFLKHFRGKRLLIFALIVMACFLFITILPYLLDGELPSNSKELLGDYYLADMLFFMVIVGTTLIAAGALVSEFEDRTALLMFTRPIRKETIFLGKFIVSYLIIVGMMGIYYLAASIMAFIVADGVPVEILSSFGILMLFVFTVTGVAFLLSAFMKRGSTATVITFLLLLMSMIGYGMFMAFEVESWFDLYYNFLAVSTVISGKVTYFDPNFNMTLYYPEIPMAAIMLLIYGIVTATISLLWFRRREF